MTFKLFKPNKSKSHWSKLINKIRLEKKKGKSMAAQRDCDTSL